MQGLILKNVSKTFAGKKVVDKISLELTKPSVYGLLGTNGAGKTTTIRMILGILKKDSGEPGTDKRSTARVSILVIYQKNAASTRKLKFTTSSCISPS